MKIKTEALKDAPLDWVVAHMQGVADQLTPTWTEADDGEVCCWLSVPSVSLYSPSRCWASGGPLIDQYSVSLMRQATHWEAIVKDDDGLEHASSAKTPLVAAMRSIVAAKMGGEVSVPDALTTPPCLSDPA
tara:strand:+ start:3379 stop:3771 length:393 start_codon:yes stop_codon:yes gene_type:complete